MFKSKNLFGAAAAMIAAGAMILLTAMSCDAAAQVPNPQYQIVVSYCWEGVPEEADGCDMTVREEPYPSLQSCEAAAHSVVQQLGAFFTQRYPTARLYVQYGCVESYDS